MVSGQHADVARTAAELRVVLGQLVRRLREHSPGCELTRSQTVVLGRLDREGAMTTSQLARAEGVRPQSMAAIIAALTTKGLVASRPDASDGRKTLVEPTELARKYFHAGRLAREDWLVAAMNDVLSRDEIDQLAAVITLIKKLI